MKDLRLNHKYRCELGTRLALASAVAGVCALITFQGPVWAQTYFACLPQEAAVFPGSRIHVQCDRGAGDDGLITFFALSVINPDVSRVLSLIETAVTANRPLQIEYNPDDLTGAAYGCQTNNCRLIQGVHLQNPAATSGGR